MSEVEERGIRAYVLSQRCPAWPEGDEVDLVLATLCVSPLLTIRVPDQRLIEPRASGGDELAWAFETQRPEAALGPIESVQFRLPVNSGIDHRGCVAGLAAAERGVHVGFPGLVLLRVPQTHLPDAGRAPAGDGQQSRPGTAGARVRLRGARW